MPLAKVWVGLGRPTAPWASGHGGSFPPNPEGQKEESLYLRSHRTVAMGAVTLSKGSDHPWLLSRAVVERNKHCPLISCQCLLLECSKKQAGEGCFLHRLAKQATEEGDGWGGIRRGKWKISTQAPLPPGRGGLASHTKEQVSEPTYSPWPDALF